MNNSFEILEKIDESKDITNSLLVNDDNSESDRVGPPKVQHSVDNCKRFFFLHLDDSTEPEQFYLGYGFQEEAEELIKNKNDPNVKNICRIKIEFKDLDKDKKNYSKNFVELESESDNINMGFVIKIESGEIEYTIFDEDQYDIVSWIKDKKDKYKNKEIYKKGYNSMKNKIDPLDEATMGGGAMYNNDINNDNDIKFKKKICKKYPANRKKNLKELKKTYKKGEGANLGKDSHDYYVNKQKLNNLKTKTNAKLNKESTDAEDYILFSLQKSEYDYLKTINYDNLMKMVELVEKKKTEQSRFYAFVNVLQGDSDNDKYFNEKKWDDYPDIKKKYENYEEYLSKTNNYYIKFTDYLKKETPTESLKSFLKFILKEKKEIGNNIEYIFVDLIKENLVKINYKWNFTEYTTESYLIDQANLYYNNIGSEIKKSHLYDDKPDFPGWQNLYNHDYIDYDGIDYDGIYYEYLKGNAYKYNNKTNRSVVPKDIYEEYIKKKNKSKKVIPNYKLLNEKYKRKCDDKCKNELKNKNKIKTERKFNEFVENYEYYYIDNNEEKVEHNRNELDESIKAIKINKYRKPKLKRIKDLPKEYFKQQIKEIIETSEFFKPK